MVYTKLHNYQIRKSIRARLIRRYRGGLIKKKTKAERAFEALLTKVKADFISQAAFLSPWSFYIVDFYIKSPYKLIVEINGSGHRRIESIVYDKRKIAYLRQCGFRVLTFADETVLRDEDRVERQLRNCLNKLKNLKDRKMVRPPLRSGQDLSRPSVPKDLGVLKGTNVRGHKIQTKRG